MLSIHSTREADTILFDIPLRAIQEQRSGSEEIVTSSVDSDDPYWYIAL